MMKQFMCLLLSLLLPLSSFAQLSSSDDVTVTVGQSAQVIVFAALPQKTLGDPPFTVSATGGASGNPVTFASTTVSVCITSGTNGSTVTLVAVGACSVRASQAGNVNYSAAADVTQSFNVVAANQPPMVNAGPDITVTLPAAANLSATVTDDGLPAGSTLGFQWTKVSGPGTVTFANPMSRTTTATFSVAGTYVLRFTANEIVGTGSVVGEEFVGPFASWLNVKTGFGAVANGVADDTVAIQNAMNALSTSSPVLYFPAGRYKITQTPRITAKLNISLIGEDPATTFIEWHGITTGPAANRYMLFLDGVAYSKVSRFTFDGRGQNASAIRQEWNGSSGNFDTGNEYSDLVIKDIGYGIAGGFNGAGFAETSVLRVQFIRNQYAGIILGNFNALDLWVWNSSFTDCGEGISNTLAAGNFNVYNTNFSGSTIADISIQATGFFNFRNNYSINSKKFFQALDSNNPAAITLQGNVILDPIDSESISIHNLGPILSVDNVIRSRAGAAGPVVAAPFTAADVMSIGNTFTVSGGVFSGGRLKSIDDVQVARTAITNVAPVLPGTPPNYNRTIFNIAPGSSAATIQGQINAAVAASTGGTWPVVHLPPSTLSVGTTLIIPANAEIQIIGDGGNSILQWNTAGAGPVLRLQGPSRVRLRDFLINGNNGVADGIVIETANQLGARIFGEQLFTKENYGYSLFLDALTNTSVQLHNFEHQQRLGTPAASIKIAGSNVTNVFAGASSDVPGIVYDVSGGAAVTLLDIWYESVNTPSRVVNLTGSGSLTFNGARIAAGAAPSADIHVNGFTGTATFLELLTYPNNTLTGNGTGLTVSGTNLGSKILASGWVGGEATLPLANTSSPSGAYLAINNQTTLGAGAVGAGSVPIADSGTYSAQHVRDTTAQLRAAKPLVTLLALPMGVTDVRMYRVTVDRCKYGVHVKSST